MKKTKSFISKITLWSFDCENKVCGISNQNKFNWSIHQICNLSQQN
uniref:Uncharacterized protein n=1 Tax=Arundo donax TaxID=35708 RepID=A0A0A9CAU9_ARUDO